MDVKNRLRLDHRRSSVRPEVVAALVSRMRSGSRSMLPIFPASLPSQNEIILYVGSHSPASKLVWLYLLQHSIPHDRIVVDTEGAETERCLKGINPLGVLPTLVNGSTVVYGGPSILYYLADYYTESAGLGKTPAERAKIESLISWASDHLTRVVYSQLVELQLDMEDNRHQDPLLCKQMIDKATQFVVQHIHTLQNSYLSDHKKKFLLGDEPSLADSYICMILTALELISFNLKRYPTIQRWMKNVRCHHGGNWEKVCETHNIRVMQKGSRRASLM